MKVVGVVFLCIASVFCQQTTVERLVSDGRFTTLVKYVIKANLTDTLNSGNFTIFAPTDTAFANLDPAIKAALDSDNGVLTDALLYHVISGRIPSSAASNELKLTMANNKDARINVYNHNNKVTIQGSVISQFDIAASNGIIHVLDSVMLAPTGNIVDYVSNEPEFSTLLSLVLQTGIADTLKADGLTVFAPTDAAFARIPDADLTSIKNDPARLMSILTYHVVNGTQYSAGLWQKEQLATLNPNDDLVIHFVHHQEDIKVDNGLVTTGNVGTTNGVIHVVDHVLIPHKDPAFVG